MRLTDFWYRLEQVFGVGYAASVASDQVLATLGGRTIEQALAGGQLAGLRQASVPCRAALKPQLRALLHYHLGTAAMRTRQVMLDAQKLLEPPLNEPVSP